MSDLLTYVQDKVDALSLKFYAEIHRNCSMQLRQSLAIIDSKGKAPLTTVTFNTNGFEDFDTWIGWRNALLNRMHGHKMYCCKQFRRTKFCPDCGKRVGSMELASLLVHLENECLKWAEDASKLRAEMRQGILCDVRNLKILEEKQINVKIWNERQEFLINLIEVN